jgi:hypothetical protein
MGVIVWVYQMLLLLNYVGSTYAHREIAPVDLVESKYAKLADFFLIFLFYTSTICMSTDSSECIFSGQSDPNGTCSKMHAAACFSWFAFFGLLGVVYLRDPESFKKLVMGSKSDHYDDIDKNTFPGAQQAAPKAAVDL